MEPALKPDRPKGEWASEKGQDGAVCARHGRADEDNFVWGEGDEDKNVEGGRDRFSGRERRCVYNGGDVKYIRLNFWHTRKRAVTHHWCRPHSVFCVPRQRPARGSSPILTGVVQGAQPMDG